MIMQTRTKLPITHLKAIISILSFSQLHHYQHNGNRETSQKSSHDENEKSS